MAGIEPFRTRRGLQVEILAPRPDTACLGFRGLGFRGLGFRVYLCSKVPNPIDKLKSSGGVETRNSWGPV